MVNIKKQEITGNMLKFGKDSNREVLKDVYIQSRGSVVRGEQCDKIGLEKVINYTGVGYREWHNGMLLDLLDGEVGDSKRNGFIDVIERATGEDGMVVVVASVLVFRDWYSMNMFVLRDYGRYWDTELRYEVEN